MAKKKRIVRGSAEDLQAMRARGESRSDWAAAQSIAQVDVERLAQEEGGPLPEGREHRRNRPAGAGEAGSYPA
jgi:hypothetical protein